MGGTVHGPVAPSLASDATPELRSRHRGIQVGKLLQQELLGLTKPLSLMQRKCKSSRTTMRRMGDQSLLQKRTSTTRRGATPLQLTSPVQMIFTWSWTSP